MGTIQIKKIEKTVTTGKMGQERQKVKKTYGKIIYRGTLSLNDMAEHIMKHGTVYTEDVVIGVITKLKNCMQEMLADGYKVKLDGIGTLYPVTTSEGVADAKDYNAQENITRVGISFLADQSKRSLYKASAMKLGTTLSTKLYNELTGEGEEEGEGGDPSTGGSGQGGSSENGGSNGNSGNGGDSGNSGGSSSSSVAAPTISGTTPFDDSTQVTISGPAGSSIKYTTNGVAPTATYGNDYEEPITLNASATVKAVAIIDGVASEVATKAFVKNGSQGGSGEEGM